MATIIVSKNTTGTYTNTGYTGVNDTRMRGLSPTTNYASGTFVTTNCWDTSANDCGNALFKFDVSSVGAGTVTNAEIGFWLTSGNNDFRGISLYQLLVDFIDTEATFNIRKTSTNWNTPNARGAGTDRASTAVATASRSGTSGVWMTFTGSALNALIEDYLDGTTTNNGFTMEITDYADDLFTFQDYTSSEGTDGNRPYLKFDFTASSATGTSATTNANDTSSASGTTTVTGTSARTNANDTSSASGTTTIVASSATTNAADTANASGSIGQSISGSVTYTNVNDTSSAIGTTTVIGTSTRTNNNDASSATGTTTIIATSATTNANDTLTASGVTGTVSGTVAYTNNNDIAYAFDFLPTSTSAGVSSSFYKRRRIIIEREEEKEEEPEVIVRKVKRLIARKITNKQIAQKVQAQVIEQVQFQSIDLTQAQKLIDDLKQQEILARMRKKQMQDDEEAIQFFI